MGVGVYVKPGSPSALDIGGGGGGFAGGRGTSWQPSTVNLRPVNPTRANAPVGGRAVNPNSGRNNLGGFNNRAPAPGRGFGARPAPAPATTRPFTGGPGSRGGRSSGFGELLKQAGVPRAPSRPAQGFGRTAQNPPLKAAPRPVPVDTPTPGAKRPFNFRQPFAGIPRGSLPGNPFAPPATPFTPSGADDIPAPTYPGQLPPGATAPGRVLIPAQPGQPGVNWAANRGFQWHGTNGVPGDRPGRITNPGIFFNQRTSDLIYATGYVEWENPPGVPGTPFVVLTNDAYWGHTDPFYNPNYETPAYQTAPQPDTPPVYAPNPSRPTAPRPLPGADPNAAPVAPPRPAYTPPGQPAKQPLPYPSPDPVPLAPGDGPLPDTMQPPPEKAPDPTKRPAREADKRPFEKSGGNSSPFSPQTAFTTGVAIGRSLGATATRAINSTDAEQVKELVRSGIKLRAGEQRAATTPISGINGSGQPVPIVEIIKEVVPTAPPESFEKCPPTGGTDCKYDGKNIAGKCDNIKKLLDDNLGVDYSASVAFLPCEDDETPETITLESEGKGMPGIDKKLDILAQAINLIWEQVKCDKQPLISMTESWEIKKELNTPQLVVITKKPNDKTSFRRNFSIPHPSITTEEQARAIFATRRTYERGNKLVTLTLKDNSKIKLNVDSDATGQTLMDWLVDHCLDLSYRDTPPGQYRITSNAGREIIPCQVEFYSIAFYSEGKKGDMPEWQFIIPS